MALQHRSLHRRGGTRWNRSQNGDRTAFCKTTVLAVAHFVCRVDSVADSAESGSDRKGWSVESRSKATIDEEMSSDGRCRGQSSSFRKNLLYLLVCVRGKGREEEVGVGSLPNSTVGRPKDVVFKTRCVVSKSCGVVYCCEPKCCRNEMMK
ncbi:uncharacterized protein MYCGRDRAFT_104645 [Zymoseptoria tritici IPO323]|uniref:Uncharacterized protein n=1 Tax=Zymoseptoria tritici (strain CBS 115943 / IPO323) TaxID=336722 RepID=F9XCC5_ZYMTI|nr:uncharacterized protein MYCGRDRAFT_104645 [Zymoseptoria tritici IPO323]EGP87321.1 hypothetical protein MYCGRDRAFT_104645 [Zymoseptoria tritici IPO323]